LAKLRLEPKAARAASAAAPEALKPEEQPLAGLNLEEPALAGLNPEQPALAGLNPPEQPAPEGSRV
jgi:hypothetical protein